MQELTRSLVEAQATDASSLSAGRGLASTAKWQTLGRSDRLLWGECKGSGSKPYVVQVDRSDLVAKCSCPSRKFPCKHSLALMLLAAEGSAPAGEEPDWATAWLEKRSARAAAKDPAAPVTPEQAQKLERERAARAAKRAAKVDQGMEELTRWLDDLLAEGLLEAQGRSGSWWDGVVRRMVDAQAPRAAELVEALARTVRGGRSGWEEQAADLVGELLLSAHAWRGREALAGTAQDASLRAALGLPLEEVTTLEGTWRVLGSVQDELGRGISVRHTWVTDGERPRLLRTYAHGGSFSPEPPAGQQAPATLTLPHPDADHARASWRLDEAEEAPLPEGEGVAANLRRYAAALAEDPWLTTYPFCVRGRTLPGEPWQLCDEEGWAVPLRGEEGELWAIHAETLGTSADVWGTWDGSHLAPGYVRRER